MRKRVLDEDNQDDREGKVGISKDVDCYKPIENIYI